MTAERALAILKLQCAYDAEPTVTEAELTLIRDEEVHAATYETATAYVYGDIIVPTARNGHSYMCIVAGTSGATEPDWPIAGQSQIGDGTGDLVWQENGPDWDNLYRLDAATRRAWLLKAAKAAGNYQFSTNDQSFNRQQVHDHCMKMADKFADRFIA
jgi:hypothetical protein